ncbi:MAG: SDR family NAD(P)-dependent oxidoreductase [Rhizomicrobium sp.]
MIDRLDRAFGHIDIDFLVNNAGIQFVSPIEDFPADKWDAIIALNLSAVFHTTKAVFEGMKARGFGRIINIASAHTALSPRRSSRPMSRPSTVSSA